MVHSDTMGGFSELQGVIVVIRGDFENPNCGNVIHKDCIVLNVSVLWRATFGVLFVAD